MNKHEIRRFDIDWIRVLSFDVLILYHVGMFFVPWEFHIKNNDLVEWFRWPMLFINQWRLPLLLVVSGMSAYYSLSKRSSLEFIVERSKRIIIPLIIGVFVLVAPQVYIERVLDGTTKVSFFEFYPSFFDGLYPEGNFSWHHLWFLPYLLIISIIALPILNKLKRVETSILHPLKCSLRKHPWIILFFIIPIALCRIFLDPYFPRNYALIGDWFTLVYFFILFIFGYTFICLGPDFWNTISRIRYYVLVAAFVGFLTLVLCWEFNLNYIIQALIQAFNSFSWIIVILAFSYRYLNSKNSFIVYRNESIFPFYILHQTIIIWIGYLLMDLNLHYALKFIIMVLGTFLLSFVIYDLLIKRMRFLRPLFGLKKIDKLNINK